MMISSVGLGFVSIDDSDHLAVFVKQNGHSLAGCGAHDSLRANPNNAYAAINDNDNTLWLTQLFFGLLQRGHTRL